MIFGYWGIKARGEASRLLMAYTKQEYKEENPESNEEWYKKKYTLDFEFPDLPYLVDGDLRLTQSQTIFRYIAERSGDSSLLGSTPKERARISMYVDVLEELFNVNFKTMGTEDHLAVYKDVLEKTIVPYLTQLEKTASADKFLLGDLTVCDFKLYVAREIIGLWASCLKLEDPFSSCKKLLAIVDRFEQIPAIREYHDSDKGKNSFEYPNFLPKLK